jgi:hypothetical protein
MNCSVSTERRSVVVGFAPVLSSSPAHSVLPRATDDGGGGRCLRRSADQRRRSDGAAPLPAIAHSVLASYTLGRRATAGPTRCLSRRVPPPAMCVDVTSKLTVLRHRASKQRRRTNKDFKFREAARTHLARQTISDRCYPPGIHLSTRISCLEAHTRTVVARS